jgi:hypothetical protein
VTAWPPRRAPLTPDALRAILDPAGDRPAPYWAREPAAPKAATRRAWDRRMRLVERARQRVPGLAQKALEAEAGQ